MQGGQFELTYTMLRGLLDSRVATEEHDPTAFYTADEYTEAVEMLKTVIERRAESIWVSWMAPSCRPPTASRRTAVRFDASDLDLSIMGSRWAAWAGARGLWRGRGAAGAVETGAAVPPHDGQERESPE